MVGVELTLVSPVMAVTGVGEYERALGTTSLEVSLKVAAAVPPVLVPVIV